MDPKIEKTLRKLGPTPLRVLDFILHQRTPTSTATVKALNDLDKNAVGGGYSVLSRNNFIRPSGRDKDGSLKWEVDKDIEDNRDTILDLIKRLK